MHHTSSMRQSLRLRLVLVSITVVMLACGAPATVVQHHPSSVSAQIKAAVGGTLKHPNGATLTIPPNALAADATVTLTDSGAPYHFTDDPLRYVSDAFLATTQDASGKTVAFKSPATLSINASGKTSDTIDLIVAEVDPGTPNLVHLHHSASGPQASTVRGALAAAAASGALTAASHLGSVSLAPRNGNTAVSYNYNTPGSSMWSVGVVGLAQPNPQEQDVLQVPFYHQSGLGWCVPTSLTEMLHYFDITPTNVDPLNATFGSDTALANWQIAAANQQSANAWANYGELDALGIHGIGNALGTGVMEYAWDDDFVITDPIKGASGNFNDFEAYVVEVNTGLFGFGERKPLMLAVDQLEHSLVIVGVDANDIYLHDSNGAIAEKLTWTAFQAEARGINTNDQGKPYEKHEMVTAVAYGYPIRAQALRQGSIVIMQGSPYSAGVESYDSMNNPTYLNWDGASPHVYGYYLTDPSYKGLPNTTAQLGYPLLHPQPIYYQYRIANVTNVPLTYTSAAELSGPTFGAGVVSQQHSVTVQPYSLSTTIIGKFDAPSWSGAAFLDIKLFEVGSTAVVQDAKIIRLGVQDAAPPEVHITLPADGTHVYAGTDVTFNGTGFDPNTGSSLPWSDLSWSANSTSMGDGNSVVNNFANTGTYTITLQGNTDVGVSAKTSITLHVDPAPPSAFVSIVAPTDGSYITVPDNATTYDVQLIASGSSGMVFTWSDSIDGNLGQGTDITDSLTVQNQGNCAPATKHVITLSGTDNLNRTKTAQITIYLRPLCVQ